MSSGCQSGGGEGDVVEKGLVGYSKLVGAYEYELGERQTEERQTTSQQDKRPPSPNASAKDQRKVRNKGSVIPS